MGCGCGNRRVTPWIDASRPAEPAPAPRAPRPYYFQYIGKTALTAVGGVTGHRYRFPAPGALLAVDERDAPSFAAIPNLRRAPSPE